MSIDDCLSRYAKLLAVGEAKLGKTVFLVSQLLGVFPGQEYGGVVTEPETLHLIAIDSGAISGVRPFLKMCGLSPEDINRISFYNLQEAMRKANIAEGEWDYTFFNKVLQTYKEIETKVQRAPKSVHAVVFCSLTSLSQTLERQLAGPSTPAKRGSGMDQSKWSELARQISEIRNFFQQDRWHCIWESHTYRPPATGQGQSAEAKPETIQMSGKSGYNFPNNVEQVIRLRREHGNTLGGTKIDRMYMDTRPALDFLSGGRGFTENLKPQEGDMTEAFNKLGLEVGQWEPKKGSKSMKQGKK